MNKRSTIESIAYGNEPVFDKLSYSQTEFITFLNYYNYNSNHNDIKNYTIEYLKINNPDVVKLLHDVPKTLFNNTLGSLCRMITRNYPPSEYILNKIETLLQQLIEIAKEKELAKPIIEKVKIKDKDGIDGYISEIDGYLDYCIQSDSFIKKDVNKYLTIKKINKKDCIEIANYYKPLLNELKESPENYDTTKQNHDKFIKIVEEIINTFSTVGNSRKARIKRPIDPKKLVAKVKYLKDYQQYGLKSINPIEILGKHSVLLYDTKYNKIQMIIGKDLTIRGSTIFNIDKEISISKTVRNPAIIQNNFLMNDFEYVLGSFRLLNTKVQIPSGSINDNVLILRVFD